MTDETAANGHDEEEGLEAEAAAEDTQALQAEIAALKEKILRIAADAENTKRRAERDANDARAYAIQKFARDLLGAADNLALATAHAPKDVADQLVKNFVVGVEMTQKELLGAFERNGLVKVEPGKGDKFDPHLHQAMMEQPGEDVPPGAVIKTLQAGYQLMGRIVRPAMVVVAAKGAGAGPAGETPAQNPYAAAEADEAGGAVDQKA
jgi:molecular chaperone GrpE